MNRLPRITPANQWPAIGIGYLFFCAVYLGSAALAPSPAHRLAFGPFETVIPMLDWSIWIYGSQFVLLPLAIVLAQGETKSMVFYAKVIATCIAALCFIAWPTEIARPSFPVEGVTATAWQLLYASDVPRNCFPSLHVALATLAGVALWRSKHRVTALLWPSLVILSTLTTRQHVPADVLGGLLLAPLAWFITAWLLSHERTQSAYRPADS